MRGRGNVEDGTRSCAAVRLVVLLALFLFLPSAGAHPGDEFETLSSEAGNVTFYVTPQTLVVKAQRDVVFLGEATELRDQRYSPVLNATWAMAAVGPVGAPVELQPYGQGFAARVNFSAPGEWTLRVSANGTSAELPLRVYPPTGVRAESTSLRYNLFYVGRETEAGLYFLDDLTGSLLRDEGEVLARVERWENETKQTEETVALARGRSTGEYSLDYAFQEEGLYLVRIASAQHAIGFDDLPPFKVNVLPARLAEDDVGTRATPGGGALALLVSPALVALALRRQ